jgi:hypothetical protein
MRGNRDRRLLLGLFLLMATSFGCSPLLLPFYIFGNVTNSTLPPDFPLYETAKKEKKRKEFKIVILPYRAQTLSPSYIGKERTLATMVSRQLTERFAANKEYVKIVPINEVEKFQRTHSEWQSMDPGEIGKQFGADYVVDMELAELRLFERKSHGMFLNGYCRVSLTVNDVEKVGQEPVFKQDFPMQFPKSGPRVADLDDSAAKFEQDFFNQIAVRLAWVLTAHPTGEQCECAQ